MYAERVSFHMLYVQANEKALKTIALHCHMSNAVKKLQIQFYKIFIPL